jgi:hypothetical protein
MDEAGRNATVITVTSLREYFREALHGALVHQHVAVEGETEQYVVNLLTLFARAEHVHGGEPGTRFPPLARLFAQAADSAGEARAHALQRLGDLSLFLAGFFAHGFARSLVDIDYHVAMGGRAYGALAESLARGRRRVLGQVYAELASKFMPMVDALSEVSDSGRVYSGADILRFYEIWLHTGSQRARAQLGKLGVQPTPVALRAH